jgi:hypothetical protein
MARFEPPTTWRVASLTSAPVMTDTLGDEPTTSFPFILLFPMISFIASREALLQAALAPSPPSAAQALAGLSIGPGGFPLPPGPPGLLLTTYEQVHRQGGRPPCLLSTRPLLRFAPSLLATTGDPFVSLQLPGSFRRCRAPPHHNHDNHHHPAAAPGPRCTAAGALGRGGAGRGPQDPQPRRRGHARGQAGVTGVTLLAGVTWQV